MPPGTSACAGAFITAVRAAPAAPLLFLSESDRPFDITVFAGAGASAPTASSVLALVGAEAGSGPLRFARPTTTSPRSSPRARPMPPRCRPRTPRVTDVVYVAVFKPASDPYNAEYDVYLVGRASCGDLVGIHAISIET